jgi:hypothetical protein
MGLDDILSVTSSAEAAAARGDSTSISTPQSPERITDHPEFQNQPSSSSQEETYMTTKTSTSNQTTTTNQENICSILNRANVDSDAKVAAQSSTTYYDKELEPIKDSLGAKSASPAPSARSQSPNHHFSPQCTSPKPNNPDKKDSTPSNRPKNLFASAKKSFRKNKVQKQYTLANMYPTPMFKSMDLDSPDGSFSSMGFVGSALGVNMPFASQSTMNATAARRARMAHNRTKSVISRNAEQIDRRGVSPMYHSSGRLCRTNSTRTSAMSSYDNLPTANGGGGSLHSPSTGLLGEHILQYGGLGGSVGTAGLDNAQHHSVPGSTNILPQTSPSGTPSPKYLSRSPPRTRTRGLNRQVTLNPSFLSSTDNYQRRSPTPRLPTSLQTIPSQSGQDGFIPEVKSPYQQQKSIMKQRSLPANEEPPSRVFKDDQGFLKPNNVPFPSTGFIRQGSIDSHRSSISSIGNASIPAMQPCTSPGSPNSRSTGIIRQLSSSRSPRSPNMSRQISKISDQISMIDEEAEDAIEAAASAIASAETQAVTNGVNHTNEHERHILPTSQRRAPSFRQMSMRSTTVDNYRPGSFGTGGNFNSQSSRQGSLSRQSPGLKRQVTICEDSMSIPESGNKSK